MTNHCYSIKEASQKTQLTADTIRYYEKIGLLPPVTRNQAGVRLFSEVDLTILTFIRHLKGVGMSLEDLKNYMDLVQEGDKTSQQRLNFLKAERDRLLGEQDKLAAAIALLTDKIAHYEEVMKPVENHFFEEKSR